MYTSLDTGNDECVLHGMEWYLAMAPKRFDAETSAETKLGYTFRQHEDISKVLEGKFQNRFKNFKREIQMSWSHLFMSVFVQLLSEANRTRHVMVFKNTRLDAL